MVLRFCGLQRLPANYAWQMLCILALNVFRSFQMQTGAPVRLRSRKCTFPHRLQSLRTLR